MVLRLFNAARFIAFKSISSTFLSISTSTSSATLEILFSLSRSFTTFRMFDFIIKPITNSDISSLKICLFAKSLHAIVNKLFVDDLPRFGLSSYHKNFSSFKIQKNFLTASFYFYIADRFFI